MGGGGSRPAPPPTVVEQEPPAGSGQSSIVYADRPDTPRLDGLTRSIANECNGCNLQIASGISSSSVKLSREFGEVTDVQCKRYRNDRKRVDDKQLSFQDFLGNLKAGRYMRNLDNGYCEQITISEEDSSKVKKIGDVTDDKIQSVRIQKVSSGGFSSDTKAKLTPSIPFKLSFNGQEITVKTMSVYHPCPLRIEGVQPDAVFSLNDPSFDNGTGYIVLIPLVAKNTADPSIAFFDKILPQINALNIPEATGQYMTRNVPTGTDWSLTKVFSASKGTGDSLEVQSGYYEWKGMPALERVREDGNNTITYSWKESGKPSPRYIMLDTPVAISASSLTSVTQTLPVTPSSDAIHAVLYSSNPLQRGIVHKQGPPNPGCARESFADMNGVKEEFCDAWTAWAQTSEPKGFSTQQIFELMFKVLVFVAMAVGAYIALAAVLRLYDVELSNVSTGLGKITATVFKSLKQKAGDMKGMGNLGAFAALASGKVPNTDAIAAIQAAKDKSDGAAAEVKRKAAEAKAAAVEVKRKAEEEAVAKATAAKAAADKSAKENADKALAAATEAKKAAAAEAKAAADAKSAAEAKAAKDKADADAKAAKDKADADAKSEADAKAAAAEKAAKDKADAEAAAEAERKKAEEAAQAAAAAKLNEARAKSAEVPKPAPVTPPTTPKWKKNQFTNMDYLKQRGLKAGKPKRGRGRVGSTRRAGY